MTRDPALRALRVILRLIQRRLPDLDPASRRWLLERLAAVELKEGEA